MREHADEMMMPRRNGTLPEEKQEIYLTREIKGYILHGAIMQYRDVGTLINCVLQSYGTVRSWYPSIYVA